LSSLLRHNHEGKTAMLRLYLCLGDPEAEPGATGQTVEDRLAPADGGKAAALTKVVTSTNGAGNADQLAADIRLEVESIREFLELELAWPHALEVSEGRQLHPDEVPSPGGAVRVALMTGVFHLAAAEHETAAAFVHRTLATITAACVRASRGHFPVYLAADEDMQAIIAWLDEAPSEAGSTIH